MNFLRTTDARLRSHRSCSVPVTIFAVLGLSLFAAAQNFTVLHTFTRGGDGGAPAAGLTIDSGGNLYGVTSTGGSFGNNYCSQSGCGTVFRMQHRQSGWMFLTLHNFDFVDGVGPASRVIIGPDGALYGTSFEGGDNRSLGLVYRLAPPPTLCRAVFCPWTTNVIWRFNGSPDGARPGSGDLFFGGSGHLYGTTTAGGANGVYGTVYQLSNSDGSWAENVEYSFAANSGHNPAAGVIFDSSGNMYTTTPVGPGSQQCGTVLQLVPSGSGLSENVLHSFSCFGYSYPTGGLIMDRQGNLYGSVSSSGNTQGGGAVFELTAASGYQDFILLYAFYGNEGPVASLTMDAAGNLYGTTVRDGNYGWGNVFKLTPSQGGWLYASLHDFTGGADGGWPEGQVTVDAHGNLFGTAIAGGSTGSECPFGCGVVWQITP